MKSSSKIIETFNHTISAKEFMEKLGIKGNADTLRVHKNIETNDIDIEIDEEITKVSDV